jgi:uncharacterized protein (DUF433 family)
VSRREMTEKEILEDYPDLEAEDIKKTLPAF